MQRTRHLFLVALLAAAPPVAAQAPPGGEFAVNSYTNDVQRGAAVAADAEGNFVAVWSSYFQDGSGQGIFARRFDRLGTPRGPEIQVNVSTSGDQRSPSVGTDAAGNFMVVWRTDTASGHQLLLSRRFDSAGTPRTGEVPVTAPNYGLPDVVVAMHPDGRALATWEFTSLRGRLYDPAGAPVGGEFTIASGLAGGDHVAAAPDGGYLVVWEYGGPVTGIFGVKLDAAGNRVGAEFRVNTYTTGSQDSPHVAFDGAGGFMVAWQQGHSSAADVRARRFDANGAAAGPDFLVSESTAGYQCCARLAGDRDGNFTVLWAGEGVGFDVYARRFDATGSPLAGEFVVPFDSAYVQSPGGILVAPGGHAVASYDSDMADGSFSGVLGRLLGSVPMQLSVDAAPMQSNGNGVLEAGETVALAPAWANAERVAAPITGSLSGLAGPGPSSYSIQDGTADYGLVAPQQTASCTARSDCYAVSVSAPAVRPATHWDASVRERVTGLGDQTWSLHVGGSFTDVPAPSAFYRFVEALLHHGVTGGCAADQYCPSAGTTREQMAAFVLAAREGAAYRPPACVTPVFGDVPASSPFCRFIEELARRGVVSGCGGGNYCPSAFVTREEMAVFALRTLDPALDPPACTTPVFGDVPASSPFCRWIEELARRGVVSGCGGGNYCPGHAVSREQMAVFVSATFGLTLYGP